MVLSLRDTYVLLKDNSCNQSAVAVGRRKSWRARDVKVKNGHTHGWPRRDARDLPRRVKHKYDITYHNTDLVYE